MSKYIFDLIQKEQERQAEQVQLIASENFVSENVLKAQGSILTNKYAEGYPGRRYYGGCEIIDEIESYAQKLAKEIFQTDYHVNVQPHSGSQANQAVFFAVLKPGDRVLGMDLNHGGHLTHGHKMNISGILYEIHGYGVDKTTELINYEEVRRIALEIKPKLIIAGASAYSRTIDFAKFREIADEVGAYLLTDIAHIAGLVSAGLHPSPFPHADFVTTTTHKTLRGPRGGLTFCKTEFQKEIDNALFPGIQGGPLEHVIAAKAVAFEEALSPEFKQYQQQIINNTNAFANAFKDLGYRIVSDGTDNHLFLIDLVSSINMTGKEAQLKLDEYLITTNKNTIPFDQNSPFVASGLRLGCAAMTTKGYKEEDFIKLAQKIDIILRDNI